MKKLIVILLVMQTMQMNAQTKIQVENLSKLAKTWGFLKYYHPAVGNGKLDWDLELLKAIEIAEKLSAKKFDENLEAWYGELPKARTATFHTQPKGDSIVAVFNEKSIKQFHLTKKLTAEFIHLYQFHFPDSNRYLTNRYKQYTLDFILNIENAFNEPTYPNRGLRLLALFRYWNIINYQFPHKKLISYRWETVLPKYIPLFWQAKNKFEYRNAIQKLTTAMQDSHAFYREDDYDNNQLFNVSFDLVKIKGRYFISGFYNTALASREGIEKGDEILKINGMPVKKYERLKLFGVTGSNTSSKSRDQAKQLLRIDSAKSYQLGVRRQRHSLNLNVARYTWAQLNHRANKGGINSVVNWKEVAKGIWHVKFCAISTERELKEMFDSIKTASTVIWDMRGYPNYALLKQTFASLMPEAQLLGINTNANLYFPGTFTLRKEIYSAERAEFARYSGKLIVLVNSLTQSLAESVSAQLALRPNTLVVGSQTAGITGNINYFDLPGGIKTSFTSVGFSGNSRSFVQQKGVKIDIRVKNNLTAVINNDDLQLKKAILLGKKQ